MKNDLKPKSEKLIYVVQEQTINTKYKIDQIDDNYKCKTEIKSDILSVISQS